MRADHLGKKPSGPLAALVEHLIRPVFEQVSAGLDRCSDSLEAAPKPEVMLAAYQRLAFDLSGGFLGNRDVVLLYLQENRGPAAGAREPIAEVRSLIGRRVVEITDLAHSHQLLADIDPRVSALAVVGAVERLLMAVLTDEDIGDPIQAGEALIRMVLDGLRRR